MPATIHRHSLPFREDAFNIFCLFKDKPGVFFLDSSLRGPGRQFSYIGFSPFTSVRGRSLTALKKTFDKYCLRRQGLSFPAGAVGYWGYDGSLYFGFYDTILAIDHRKHRLVISSLSRGRMKDVIKQLNKPDLSYNQITLPKVSRLDFKSNFTKAGYMKAVRQALEHIRRGDIYQINLSHRIEVGVPPAVHAGAVYRNLRKLFPSEFGAYLDDGEQVILSSSPERFLKLQNRTVQLKPMKGTRPRGKTKTQDKKWKEELLKSPKEIAELLMVTDLERNDLGRVCDYASVKVKAMRTIETYASVFQATSTIEGHLCGDCDQFDLLRAAFPSGSVTGCPKLEAMKIIEKLEHGPRGLYTGALGYMSFSGDMDFNVMIRTMFFGKNRITFHVGGGIVADSRPQDEWQETWDKAKPMIEALKKSFL